MAIQRRRDYTRKEPSKQSNKIYIVCEGANKEPEYFEFFRGLSSNLEIITIPPTNGTDPLKLIENAKKHFLSDNPKYELDYLQGDKVWFVFDTDTWKVEGKIIPLQQFCDNQNRESFDNISGVSSYKVWNYAQSNPSFEIWLYYHIHKKCPNATDIDSFGSFKEFVSKSISGGFNLETHPVFLEDAITNSQKNFKKGQDGMPDVYSTEIHLLGEEIFPFVKNELGKLKNKLRM